MSQCTRTILMKQGKENTEISSATYVDGANCTGQEVRKSARCDSFRLQKAFMRQGMLSATVNSSANNEVTDGPWQLLYLLGCLSTTGPQAGSRGIKDLSPHGGRRVWHCPTTRVDPLSRRAGSHQSPCCNLQDHNTPSHTITPQTSYLKIHR